MQNGYVESFNGRMRDERKVFIVVALGSIAMTLYARLDDWKRGRR